MPFTIHRYLFARYLTHIGLVMGVLAALIVLVDTVEMLRRTSGHDWIGFADVLGMVALKFPAIFQKTLHFSILVGSILCMVRLTRSQELVVLRAAGISAWQFLMPALLAALLIGCAAIMLFNPLASIMQARFEVLEKVLIDRHANSFALSDSGLWLKEYREHDGQPLEVILHARRVDEDTATIYEAIAFLFADDQTFLARVDAAEATLHSGYWVMKDARMVRPGAAPQPAPEFHLATDMTFDRIRQNFTDPESLSFWSLPDFIAVLEQAGFSSLRHRLYYQKLLSMPCVFVLMVLTAAAFGLRQARRGRIGVWVTAGVTAGFVFHFLSDVVMAIGLSGQVPPVVAAWLPVAAGLMLATAWLLHTEDG